ncbi:MAG: hypothetical protein NT145_05535 [Elusimicrobia bacterium]|nr:hypothetical protein [Elusimicrobiota bacterium]
MVEVSEEIIKTVRDLFIIRDDCYPLQIEGLNEYKVIKETFSDDIIRKHLQGMITVGGFQIDPKMNKVKWICFDFDGSLNVEFEKAKTLCKRLKEKGYNPLLEFSGRRGYHGSYFFDGEFKPMSLINSRIYLSKKVIVKDLITIDNLNKFIY